MSEYTITFETFEKYFYPYWEENAERIVLYYIKEDTIFFKFKWIWVFNLQISIDEMPSKISTEQLDIPYQKVIELFIEKYFKAAIPVETTKQLPFNKQSNDSKLVDVVVKLNDGSEVNI